MLELKIGLEVYFYGMKFKFSFEFTVFKCVLFGSLFRWTNFSECVEQGFRCKDHSDESWVLAPVS